MAEAYFDDHYNETHCMSILDMTRFKLKQPGCAQLALLAETLRGLPSFLAGQTGCMRLASDVD